MKSYWQRVNRAVSPLSVWSLAGCTELLHLLTEGRSTPSQSKKHPSDSDLMELQQELRVIAVLSSGEAADHAAIDRFILQQNPCADSQWSSYIYLKKKKDKKKEKVAGLLIHLWEVIVRM